MLFETFSAHVEIRNTYRTCGYWRVLITVSQENKLRDLASDISYISTNVQDGRQLNISNQNMSRNKANVKFLQ